MEVKKLESAGKYQHPWYGNPDAEFLCAAPAACGAYMEGLIRFVHDVDANRF
jgi:hypothetical protein